MTSTHLTDTAAASGAPDAVEREITARLDALIAAVRAGDQARITDARQSALMTIFQRLAGASGGSAGAASPTASPLPDYSRQGVAPATQAEGSAAQQQDSANRSMW